MKKRLLVEFSCELPTKYPTLRDLPFVLLLVFVTSGCHNSLLLKNTTRPIILLSQYYYILYLYAISLNKL